MVNCREKDLETSGLFIHKNLFTSQNYKTVKGEKQKYKTYVLYMKSGEIEIDGKKKNSCPNKSAACYKYCLDNAGIAIFLFVAIVIIGVIIYDSKQNLKFIFDKKKRDHKK